MKNKKVASLGFAVTMVANAVPALATETQTPHDIETHKTDDVMGTDAHVCDTQEIVKDESASCNVYAEVGSEFTVTIPKSLTLSGADKTGAYDVAVEGDIAGDQFVSVVPDAQFAMVQDGKADVTATITQEITKFRGDDYKDALGAGEAKFADGAEGAIDAQGLSAGAWNGTFNFNIRLEGAGSMEQTKSSHNIENNICTECGKTVEELGGLFDENGVMLASWDEAGIDVEKDYTRDNYQTETTSGYYVLNKPEYVTVTKVVIPEGVTSIGDFAFAECVNLTSIEIQEGVTSLGMHAFQNCNLNNFIIPSSVTNIEMEAFWRCTSLTSITIPSNVSYIGANTFYECPLTSVVFEDTTTWSVESYPSGTPSALNSSDLKDTSIAAEYLKQTHRLKIWTKK